MSEYKAGDLSKLLGSPKAKQNDLLSKKQTTEGSKQVKNAHRVKKNKANKNGVKNKELKGNKKKKKYGAGAEFRLKKKQVCKIIY